jgi:O-antigen ligase
MLKINSLPMRTTIRDTISGALSPASLFFIGTMILALSLGVTSGITGSSVLAICIGACVIAITLLLRLDAWTVTFLLMVQLYVDWYLGVGFISLTLMMILLPIYFILRTPSRLPAKLHNMLWVWILLLLIAVIPATRGISLADGAYYYFNIIFCAFIMFYMGAVITRDIVHFRLLLRSLTYYSALIAVITIVQTVTGKLLFGSTRYDVYLTSIGNYSLSRDLGIFRNGSFFINPNPSGAFFAMMLLLSLGLFFESSTFLGKALYFFELLILLPALVFSYSTGAWLSLCVGIVVFLVFVGRAYYRFLLLFITSGFAMMMVTIFPSQVALQLQHAQAPNEWLLRSGAWQTGIQVIRAFPLSGLGLGRYVYFLRAEPYRVIAQYRPLDHPHDSFLELAALGGLPLAFVFITLLVVAFWLAIHNWFRSDIKSRSLIAGGIASATALTAYSISDAGWTLTPLLALGWLILGAISALSGQRTDSVFGEWKKKSEGLEEI